jgi:sugar lactone lactonase YvrE
VWRCSTDGVISEILPRRRGVGGIVPHSDGGWVISGRNVIHLLANGEQREVLSGDEVCGYNDLGAAPDGALLAGVLRFRPFAGEDPRPGQLVRIDANAEIKILSEDVIWPNGIGFSPDGRTIYVSDYARGVVLAVPAEGGASSEFCASPRGSADGLAVDIEGGVWVALGEGGGIARFVRDGELDEVVDVPANFVSSVSFGGEDMRDVLISTADNHVHPELGGTLFQARSELAGLPVTPVVV